MLNIYGDDFSRNILEIIYQEFCTPGALDVVKDNVNPMYLTEEAYNRVLRTRGHSEAEYAWRSVEFTRPAAAGEAVENEFVWVDIVPARALPVLASLEVVLGAGQ